MDIFLIGDAFASLETISLHENSKPNTPEILKSEQDETLGPTEVPTPVPISRFKIGSKVGATKLTDKAKNLIKNLRKP